MSQLESSANGRAVPTFSIYKPYSQDQVESLKHCFIERTTIERSKPPYHIVARDGHTYLAVYDFRWPANAEKIRVIISFQQHSYGKFAVIRMEKR